MLLLPSRWIKDKKNFPLQLCRLRAIFRADLNNPVDKERVESDLAIPSSLARVGRFTIKHQYLGDLNRSVEPDLFHTSPFIAL
jgi:hypothetical protein